MLAHRLRQWANIIPALDQRVVFADEPVCPPPPHSGMSAFSGQTTPRRGFRALGCIGSFRFVSNREEWFEAEASATRPRIIPGQCPNRILIPFVDKYPSSKAYLVYWRIDKGTVGADKLICDEHWDRRICILPHRMRRHKNQLTAWHPPVPATLMSPPPPSPHPKECARKKTQAQTLAVMCQEIFAEHKACCWPALFR